MPNGIKYSTNAQTLALKKGNYWIGTGDVDKGPTSSTDYWNGITPPSSGYTIYLNKASNGPSIYVASNDSQLITITNNIAGASYTTVNECFNYFNGQSDKMVVNTDIEGIVTNGLQLYIDAGFLPSYPRNGTTWTDLSGNGRDGTIINGPTYNSGNGGYIDFDGTDDYADLNKIDNTQNLTLAGWFRHPNANFVNFNGIINKDNQGNARIYQITLSNGRLQQHIFLPSLTAQITAQSQIPTNTWIYFTYTSSSSNVGKLYQNATEVGSGTAIAASTANIDVTLHGFASGGGVAGNIQIAIIQIYDRPLSPDEITQNYNAQKARFGL
jgi:hypothetical protein